MVMMVMVMMVVVVGRSLLTHCVVVGGSLLGGGGRDGWWCIPERIGSAFVEQQSGPVARTLSMHVMGSSLSSQSWQCRLFAHAATIGAFTIMERHLPRSYLGPVLNKMAVCAQHVFFPFGPL